MKKFMAVLISAFLVFSMSTVSMASDIEESIKEALDRNIQVIAGAGDTYTSVSMNLDFYRIYDWEFEGWTKVDPDPVLINKKDGIKWETDKATRYSINHIYSITVTTVDGNYTFQGDELTNILSNPLKNDYSVIKLQMPSLYKVTYAYTNAPSNASTLGITPPSSTIVSNNKAVASAPTATLPTGWTVEDGKWYTDPACSAEYVFGTGKITKDTILYAKLLDSRPRYTVTFDLGKAGATMNPVSATQQVIVNESAIEPDVTEPDGWDFKGWYTDSNVKYLFTEHVTDNITLHGVWEEVEDPEDPEGKFVPLSYIFPEDGKTHDISKLPNTAKIVDNSVKLPNPDPYVKGYKFVGWFCEQVPARKAMASDAKIEADDDQIPLVEYVPGSCIPLKLFGKFEVDSSSSTSSTPAKSAKAAEDKDEVSIWGEITFIPETKVPQASAPSSSTVTITEAPVALAGPKTGSGLAIASYLTFVTGSLGMAYVISKAKKK